MTRTTAAIRFTTRSPVASGWSIKTPALGASPVPEYEGYKHLLNYARDEVRAYRLAIIFEAMDRYADVMDGFELDFNRFQIFFPPGEASKHAHLITAMLVRIREHLDLLGEKRKQHLKLIVRVPPALKNCTWAGLDIEPGPRSASSTRSSPRRS
jgi:hypothetical protein